MEGVAGWENCGLELRGWGQAKAAFAWLSLSLSLPPGLVPGQVEASISVGMASIAFPLLGAPVP